jgi:dihydrofolate synthase/folylpolyglutamate synthase
MNYEETLAYLYAQLPMFTRIGAAAIKKDLTNTLELCKRVGNPETKFKCIHIAGTNGKGSTSHMLAAILQTAGYKTGLYTSPHLKDFRERIRINGEMMPQIDVVNFVKEQQKNIEEIEPSFFEVTVAMAFKHFAGNQIDIAVIETGLGGRLDSTNVITPIVSVITNIGYDHMNLLGNTLPEIAFEKAGIIKEGVPAIVGERQPEVEDVFIRKADECDSELVFGSEEFEVVLSREVGKTGRQEDRKTGSWEDRKLGRQEDRKTERQEDGKSGRREVGKLEIAETLDVEVDGFGKISLDLTGTYQLKNLVTVLSTVKQLRKQGYTISRGHVRTALRDVKGLTGLMGRWQTISTDPLVICDTGHNEHGIREVLKNIAAIKGCIL